MKKISLFIALTLASSVASAENHSDYKDQVCAKVKQCRLGSLLAGGVPASMQDFVVQMVDAQCLTIANGFENQIIEAQLEQEAKSCVATLSSQSCESLLATTAQENTEQCNDFLDSADKAGIDFSRIEF